MSHRKQQIESTLQRAISKIVCCDLSDPRIEGMVSVTDVQVSNDMRQATVMVSVLPEKYETRTLGGLEAASGHLHRRLCRMVKLRIVPRLQFRLDKTLKKQADLFLAIRKASSHSQGTDSENGSDPRQETDITAASGEEQIQA